MNPKSPRRRPVTPNLAKTLSENFVAFLKKTIGHFQGNQHRRIFLRQRQQHLQSNSAAKEQWAVNRKFNWFQRYLQQRQQTRGRNGPSRNLGDWFWPRIAQNPSTSDAAARMMRSAAAALLLFSLITLVISAIPLKLTTANWYLELIALIGESIPILVISCVFALLSLTLDSDYQINRAYRNKLIIITRFGYILALLLLPLQLGLLAWLYGGTFDNNRNQRNAIVANSEALIAGAQQASTTEQFASYLRSRNLNINIESIKAQPLTEVKSEFVRSVRQQQQQQEDSLTANIRSTFLRYTTNGIKLFNALAILAFFLRGFQAYIRGSSLKPPSADKFVEQPKPTTKKLHKQANDRKPLQGMIDLITPSQVIGWVSHSQLLLTKVSLFQGTMLIATASIDIARPDVAERLAQPGAFGFQLNIPDSHPDPCSGVPLRLLAMTADGSFSFPLFLPQDGGELTAERLSMALGPERRGLRGHFDGLSLNGKVLHGWCYSRSLGSATVWLHAEGLPPRELSCNLDRPGMAAQGHEEACGFALPLVLWPEAAGRKVWASFDPSGVLRLPPLHPVQLPLEQSA